LLDIALGIEDAIREAETLGVHLRVNPHFPDQPDDWDKYQRPVEFDIAVTDTDTREGGGRAGLKIFVADLAAEGKAVKESSSANRLRFTLPMIFPLHSTLAKRS
jgi:hypothetical protein